MPSPTTGDVQEYLGYDPADPAQWEWGQDALAAALSAEAAAQALLCAVPADGEDWPADLSEALFRRVAANLAVRALPLGLKASISEMAVATSRVGGGDSEVDRLEAPYRRIPVA